MDITLALTGFGNVGQGVASLLHERGEEYARRYGARLLLTGVADRGGAVVAPAGLEPVALLDTKQRAGTVAAMPGGEAELQGANFLNQAGAMVLLEAASTNFVDAEPGWTYTRLALERGMDVVLASKGALVLHYDEVMRLAREHDRQVMFAGTVGAPLPVLELANRVLVGADVAGFEGILNATTNQILTVMEEGASYEEGVRRAQEIGIAETDPTLDVDGWDAAAKAVIIARAVLGAELQLDQVERTGIRGVTRSDLEEALRHGQTIKLIARAEKLAVGVRARVGPERRSLTDSLGRLRNDEMGIVFQAEPLGHVSASVQQTGGVPTALSVLRDVINLARNRGWIPPR